jgi:hypothetical protein
MAFRVVVNVQEEEPLSLEEDRVVALKALLAGKVYDGKVGMTLTAPARVVGSGCDQNGLCSLLAGVDAGY